MAFEKYILPAPDNPRCSIHLLRALIGEYITGNLTKLQALEAIEEHVNASLTVNEKSDLQAWMTAIDAETTLHEKRNVADETYRVLVIAEHAPKVTTYDSAAKLKARLSWI